MSCEWGYFFAMVETVSLGVSSMSTHDPGTTPEVIDLEEYRKQKHESTEDTKREAEAQPDVRELFCW